MPFLSYAQNGEDVMLWRAFKSEPPGFYVDVGAAAPDEDSVTRAFYDRGWHGIDIEAVPSLAARMAQARPRDVTLAVAAGAAEGAVVLHVVDGTGLSTTDAATARMLARQNIATAAITVPVRPLRTILAEHAPDTIHFLKIDVEGAERAVLEGCDFEAHRPRIVLVEATVPMSSEPSHHGWEPLLLHAGYRFVFFDGLNRFYVADEWHPALARHFTTPVNVLDDYVRVSDAAWARRAVEQEVAAAQALDRVRQAEAAAEAAFARAFEQARAAARDRAHGEYAERARDEAVRLREAADAWGMACNARTEAAERHALASDTKAAEVARWAHELDAAVRDAKQETATLQGKLDAMHASTSWRATRPLRSVMWRLRHHETPTPPEPPPPEPPNAESPAPPKLAESPRPPAPMEPPPPATEPLRAAAVPGHTPPRRAVHQFHSGSATGDAVTNCMLLIRRQLRHLGYRSDIFVTHRDPALHDELRTLDELPVHDGHVLILHHSMGHDALDRVLATPAPKILYYHNITPPGLLPDVPQLRHYAALGRQQLRQLSGAVSAALAPSEYNAMELRRAGFPSVLVSNLLFDLEALPVQPRPTPDPSRSFTVLFVGRVIESKAQADLVDAFARFRDRLSRPSRLVLVGRIDSPGQYLDTLAERIAAHGLQDAVIVTGPVSDGTLDAYYAAADLYVSLSLHEGFGVPLVEAAARGIPVLAWGAGAIPYVIGPNGLLPSRAPDDVAARMLDIAADPAPLMAAQRATLARHAFAGQWPVMQTALAAAGAIAVPDPAARQALAPMLSFTVTGHAQSSYSLAAINRGIALAIEAERPGRVRLRPVETVPITDLSGLPDSVRALASRAPPVSGPDIAISQHYPVLDRPAEADAALALTFWEESLVPPDLIETLNGYDAVLAPSSFVAKVLTDSGLRRPVHWVGQAPDLTRFMAVARERQGVPCDPFTFLHVSSCFPRKGVDVLLAAFARAFRVTDPVRLVIKGFPNPHNDVAGQIAALRAADPDAPCIELIDRDLDEDALLDLYRTAGAMVLPTRGEGFNLAAAEAMAAGLPLIVTGFGGHMDFCDPATARLIRYTMAPSGTHLQSPSSLWAEPDTDDLASALREAQAARHDTGATSAALERVARARVQIANHLRRAAFVARLERASLDALLRPPAAPVRIGWVTSWNVRCGVAEYARHLVGAMPPGTSEHVILADDRHAPGDAHPRSLAAWDAGNPSSMARLASAIASEDPDIVAIQHQPGLIQWHGLADLLTEPVLSGRVVAVTLHQTSDIPALEAGLRERVIAALRGTDRLVVHTVEDVNRLHTIGLAGQTVLIPHGVSPGPALPSWQASATSTDPVIGCYGFFLPGKGIPELIAALGLLRQIRPGARLRLVNAEYGQASSREEILRCHAVASSAGLADAIEWETRFLPNAQSLGLLAGCDVIVLPTQASSESSSAAVRTALQAGPPVLVTPLPLFTDVAAAVIRSAGTAPDDLAAGIEALLADEPGRRQLQARAIQWNTLHAWPGIASRFHEMLVGLHMTKTST